MNKKTRIEIVMIIIASVIYFANMIGGCASKTPVNETTAAVHTETTAQISAVPETKVTETAAAETKVIKENTAAETVIAETKAEIKGTENGKNKADKEKNKDQKNDKQAAAETPKNSKTDYVKEPVEKENTGGAVSEDGAYTDKDSVALYIHTYGHLPKNYITKNEAKDAGWDSSQGNLAKVCPGMSIGGDHFGNYEGQLPKKKGRKYFECDINYNPKKGKRGAERIIFSNDGLIYYTGDHYNNFDLLYGNP